MYNLRNAQQRPMGMQVHAVPEAERYIDSTGRKLPWSYDMSNTNADNEPAPVEKGPFGRSMRRSRSGASRSRSKTAEPRHEEDRLKAANTAAEDLVFGSLRRAGAKDESKREALGEVDPNSQTAAGRGAGEGDEPTEVLLYGFGEELQWSAIDFYERVSNGVILEDYERAPPGSRYDISRTLGRAAAQKSISRAALRKKNKFAGGEHWIKVTFDTRRAAELAIARAPHTIKGYMVFAEFFVGHGPQKDEPVLATTAGAQITSDALPPTFSTLPQDKGSPESATASSATATAPDGSSKSRLPPPPWNMPLGGATKDSPTTSTSTINGAGAPQRTTATTSFQAQPQFQTALQPRRGRIEGTTRIEPLPAELALAPKQPKASWTSWIGASEVIGSAVPRKQDNTFDWEVASFYWKLFYLVSKVR